MAQATVVKHILEAFDISQASVNAFVSSLAPSSISHIVSNLPSASDQTSAIKLLRALWTYVKIRPLILTSFCQGSSPNLSAFEDRLLEELELLILQDARNTDCSPVARIQSITLSATAICKQMQTNLLDHHSSLLLHCAKAVAQVNHIQANLVKRRIIRYVLTFHRKRRQLGYRSVMMILGKEIELEPDDEKELFHTIEEQVLTSYSQEHLPRIFKAVVLQAAKVTLKETKRRLNRIAMRITQKASDKTISEIISIMDHLVAENNNVYLQMTEAFSDMYNQTAHNYSEEQISVCSSHIACLYGLLESITPRACQKGIHTLLNQTLESTSIPFDTPSASSSSHALTDLESRRRCVLLDSVRISGFTMKSGAVLEFFESKLWSSSVSVRSICRTLLHELYVWVPGCREALLRAITISLENSSLSTRVAEEYCLLLETISTTRQSLTTNECVHALVEILKAVSSVKPPFDSRVVSAICKASSSSPSIWDKVIVVLRKLVATRSRREQRLAATGLVTLATNLSASGVRAKEVRDMLISVLDTAELSVRSHVIQMVSFHLKKQPSQRERIMPVCQWVLDRLQNFWSTASESVITADLNGSSARNNETSLDTVVEEVFDNSSNIEHNEPIPAMLRLCHILATSQPYQTFLSRYLLYLGDINGAFRAACMHLKLDSVKSSMTFLCQQFSIVMGFPCDNINHIHTNLFGLCIIVRDFLDDQLIQASNAAQSRRPNNSSKSLDHLRTVTAREACARDFVNETPEHSHENEEGFILELLTSLSLLDEQKDISVRECVSREFLRKLKDSDFSNITNQTRKKIFEIIHKCFNRTAPPLLRKRILQRDRSSTETDNSAVCTIKNSKEELSTNDGSSKGEIPETATEKTLTTVLSSLNLDKEDVRVCLNTKYIKDAERSSSAYVREYCVNILLSVMQNRFESTDWSYVLSFISLEADFSYGSDTPSNIISIPHVTVGTQSNQPQNTIEIVVLETLQKLFQNEFSESLSVKLAILYLDLLGFVLEKIRKSSSINQENVQTTVMTFVTNLLRDYSIRQLGIARKLLELLSKSFDQNDGIQFVSSLLVWLGNDTCLVDSQMCTNNEDIMQRRQRDFDEDIVAEAIAFDNDYSRVDSVVATLNGEAPCKHQETNESTSIRPTNHRINGINQMDIDEELCSSDKVEIVKQLCLNESTELAITTTTWGLKYYEAIVESLIRKLKNPDGTRDFQSSAESLVTVVQGMESFFDSEFVKKVNMRKWLWNDPLRHVIKILLSTIKLLEIHITFICNDSNDLKNRDQPVIQSLIEISNKVALFLCSDTASKILLTVSSHIDGSDLISLLESIQVICTHLSLKIKSTPSNTDHFSGPIETLVSNLQKLSQKMDKMKVTQDSEDERISGTVDIIRPRLRHGRERIRSRNKYVDGWLQEEKGNDNYADLEDFIVTMDAEDL